MRIVLLLIALVSLGGCNMVMSEEPWFTEADAVGAPHLRDGLWISTNSEDCPVDKAQPPEQWPECAIAVRTQGNQWSALKGSSGEDGRRTSPGWEKVDALLVAGDPAIVQGKMTDDSDEVDPVYAYGVIRPTRRDDQGRIVEFMAGFVSCGPLPADKEDEDGLALVTKSPFAGIKIVDGDCVADNAEAVRNAARQSEAIFAEEPDRQTVFYWVRD